MNADLSPTIIMGTFQHYCFFSLTMTIWFSDPIFSFFATMKFKLKDLQATKSKRKSSSDEAEPWRKKTVMAPCLHLLDTKLQDAPS